MESQKKQPHLPLEGSLGQLPLAASGCYFDPKIPRVFQMSLHCHVTIEKVRTSGVNDGFTVPSVGTSRSSRVTKTRTHPVQIALDDWNRPLLIVGGDICRASLEDVEITLYKNFINQGKATIAIGYPGGAIEHLMLSEAEPEQLRNFITTLEKAKAHPEAFRNQAPSD
ncbi:hypothetical protein Pelo_3430 [Pelomyxa schiedti]|nr:hypothetical protein Pelo_3430 [Pelomyxa schiedti]